MLDSGCLNYSLHASSGISCVAHHNPHINAIFVYFLMQEVFVDKIYFLTFLSMSDKSRLHQLKIITSTRSTEQASLTVGKYPLLRKNTKLANLSSTLKFFISYLHMYFVHFRAVATEWSKPRYLKAETLQVTQKV